MIFNKLAYPVVSLLLVFSCVAYAQEPVSVEDKTHLRGQNLFNQHCSSCHNFAVDGIGPQLGGIMAEVSEDWFKSFVRNPQAKINAKDPRAVAAFKKYKVPMPAFPILPEEDLNLIIAYIAQHPKPKPVKAVAGMKELTDPIVPKIQMSDLVVNLELVGQIPYSSQEALHTRIAKMDFNPHTKENYVMDLRGKLYLLKNGQATLYMDMAQQMPHFINEPGLATGFGSFAFHPEFQQNGLFYTTHTEKPHGVVADFTYTDAAKVTLQWILTEWKTNDPTGIPFKGTPRELLRVNMVTQMHGVQEITFKPLAKKGDADYGLLYVGIGDGGCVERGFPQIAHSPKQIWGSIIRIDPAGRNSKNGKYGIPPSNPFANTDKLEEIYAYGFRNPHRITWTKSGKMLATNIGQRQIESVYQVLPGRDYGWPIREGTFLVLPDNDINRVYKLPANDAKYNITYPIAQFDHDEGNAISGGYEYTGNAVPQLKGKYFFGEITNGRLFYINTAAIQVGKQTPIREWQVAYGGKKTTLQTLTNERRVDLRFGRDHEGELYIFTKPDGKIYKMVK